MNTFLEQHSLKDKIVWITGGRRIGQEIAKTFAELGADLVISYRSSEKEAQEIVEKVKPYGIKTFVVQADVSDRASVEKAVKEIGEKMGKLDILVLLASIFKPIKLENINEEDWEANFSTHVKGTFWPIQQSLSLMQPGAHIVAISDRTSLGKVYPGYLPYVVTKSGVASLVKGLAAELGPKGIFINAIAPGPVLRPTDLSEDEWEKIRSESIIKFPLTDEEAVKEFVHTVVRLSFARSSGSVYPLDFGHL